MILFIGTESTSERITVKSGAALDIGFEAGLPLSAKNSYTDFKTAVSTARGQFKHVLRCDVSSYFSSLYHHDLVAWIENAGASADDSQAFGRFLREANSGRSIDCLPQGIHPCKVVGAEFLKFVDNSKLLKSDLILRFMDDLFLFANKEHTLTKDFLSLQQLLGEKGLSLNPHKTAFGDEIGAGVGEQVDRIKVQLLRRRRELAEPSGAEFWSEDMDEDEDDEKGEEAEAEDDAIHVSLEPEEAEYLITILRNADIDEADAELVLVLLRDHGEDVLEEMHRFLNKFPSLSRNIYNFAAYVSDKTELAALIHKYLKTAVVVTEDQLFWIAKLAEDYLSATAKYGDILALLLDHPSATLISKAKVLEIPEHRFGMPDIREQHLHSGYSDWRGWACAVGTRKDKKAKQNYMLKYFANASPMNKLISECAQKL
jgi:hypothetical protein